MVRLDAITFGTEPAFDKNTLRLPVSGIDTVNGKPVTIEIEMIPRCKIFQSRAGRTNYFKLIDSSYGMLVTFWNIVKDACREFHASLREGIVNKEAADAYKLRRDEIPACEHCRHYPGCITPKICADISEGCTELRRSMADFALKSKIINTYKAYRSKTEEEKN